MAKITIKDIAEAAGVSRGTVDRVLNGRGNVKAEKRDRILKIAEKIGYEKNVIASALASNKVLHVAIVLPEPNSDPYWEGPRFEIEKSYQMMRHYGIQCHFFDFDLKDANSSFSALTQALDIKPEVILTAPIFSKEMLRFLQMSKQNDIQIYTINTELEEEGISSYIGQESYGTGYLAGKLFTLSDAKISEIAVVTLGHHSSNAKHIQDKLDGIKDYFKENQLDVKINEVFIPNFDDKKEMTKNAALFFTQNKDTRAIWFTNSRAYKFIEASEKAMLKNKIILGFDLIPQNVKLLKEGTIDFLLNQNPSLQASLSMEAILNSYLHKEEKQNVRYLPVDVVMKENCAYYIDESIQ